VIAESSAGDIRASRHRVGGIGGYRGV